MLLLKRTTKILRSINNAGERAKFYITYMKAEDGTEAVRIDKLTLAGYARPGFKLVYMFGNKKKGTLRWLYHEMIIFKPETITTIAELIKTMI